MVAGLLPMLTANRRVIAVEMQGHGHTADIDRPLSYEQMADDVAALIAHLGLGRWDIVGYSLGGGIAQQVAIRHPDAVSKLVVIAAACRRDGMYPEIVAGQAAMTAELAATWVGSPMHDAYARVAPDPEGWTTLAAKTSQMLRQDYDWSADFAAIPAPVQIVVGDADILPPRTRRRCSHCAAAARRTVRWAVARHRNSPSCRTRRISRSFPAPTYSNRSSGRSSMRGRRGRGE